MNSIKYTNRKVGNWRRRQDVTEDYYVWYKKIGWSHYSLQLQCFVQHREKKSVCVLSDITCNVLEYADTLPRTNHFSSKDILVQDYDGRLLVGIGLLKIELMLCLVKSHRSKFAQFMCVNVFGARKAQDFWTQIWHLLSHRTPHYSQSGVDFRRKDRRT